MLLYADKYTPRLAYAVELLRRCTGMACRITTDSDEYRSNNGAGINYSFNPALGGLHIQPSGLLFEGGISPVHANPPVKDWGGVPTFYPTAGGSLPFDLLASSFWLASRYEEYLPYEPDEHGRFPYTQSHAARHAYIRLPLVNVWMDGLKNAILQQWPGTALQPPGFRFVPTIDLDNAFDYRGKGLLRSTGALVRDLSQGHIKRCFDRLAVLSGARKDPFDQYGHIRQIHQGHGFRPIFFLLYAKKSARDGAIKPGSKTYLKLIDELKSFAGIGIHPSYRSHASPSVLREEIGQLRHDSGLDISQGRQHYLKLSLPETYNLLIENGIREDYSLAYAEQPGFRAGLCSPFPFYDLQADEQKELTLYPLTVMDGSLRDYKNMSIRGAEALLRELVSITKSYGGTFTSLWHERSFATDKQNMPWRELYTQMLKHISGE